VGDRRGPIDMQLHGIMGTHAYIRVPNWHYKPRCSRRKEKPVAGHSDLYSSRQSYLHRNISSIYTFGNRINESGNKRRGVMYFCSKTNYMLQCIKFILFWNGNPHVSDDLSVHHQEFKTVHRATNRYCSLYKYTIMYQSNKT